MPAPSPAELGFAKMRMPLCLVELTAFHPTTAEYAGVQKQNLFPSLKKRHFK